MDRAERLLTPQGCDNAVTRATGVVGAGLGTLAGHAKGTGALVKPGARTVVVRGRALLIGAAAATLASCQMVSPSPQPSAPQIPASTSATSQPAARSTGSGLTFTVARGDLSNSLSMQGTVQPSKSIELDFTNNGTITAVHVSTGQTVQQGDPIAELTLDSSDLQTAQNQASLADLQLQNEQATLDALKQGATPDVVAAAQAGVTSAQAALQQAQLQQAEAQQATSDQQATVASTQASLDRAEQVQELAVQQAQADYAAAQDSLKRAQDQLTQTQKDVQDRQTANTATKAQAIADADGAVRSAQRSVDDAGIQLKQAQSNPAESALSNQIGMEKLKLAQLQDALKSAKANEANAKQLVSQPNSNQYIAMENQAEQSAHDAQNAVDTEQAALGQLTAQTTPAQATDQAATQHAQNALDQANDNLTEAQARAKMLRSLPDGAPVPSTGATVVSTGQDDDQLLAAAQNAVAQAQGDVDSKQRQVQLEQLKLQDAQAAQATGNNTQGDQVKLAQLNIAARQADLQAAQAKLTQLQQGTSQADIDRETQRVQLLTQQDQAAHQSLNGVIVLKAPFDGTIAAVNVQVGQPVQSRTDAVEVASVGEMAVLANAAQSAVNQLSVNQKVDITFTGLPNVSVKGTVLDISNAASAKAAGDQTVTYPVRISLDSVPDALKLGMTAQISAVEQQASNILFVPANAIRPVNGQSIVTLVNTSGQTKDTPVQIGNTFGDKIEIVSGLQDGDVIMLPSQTSPVSASAKPS